jgi:hypothetical protein
MGFSNALLPAPDFSAAAARIAKGPIPNANSFAGPATGGAGVSPLATDASSSGPNYGGTTPVAPGVQYAGSPAAGRRHARLQRADSERSLADHVPRDEQQSIDQAAAARRAAVQALAVRYGGLPSSFSDQYGAVDLPLLRRIRTTSLKRERLLTEPHSSKAQRRAAALT